MSSDEDLIESNVRTDSAFPLRHRLLTNEQFHMNRHWESVLTPAAEVSALLQTHDGVSLEEAHMFMDALFKAMSAPRLQIVSRRDNEETWKDVMGSSLNPMFQKSAQFLRQKQLSASSSQARQMSTSCSR